ncbi:MAG TPA: hypothetical protein VGC04_01040 [Cellulomonas sp.]
MWAALFIVTLVPGLLFCALLSLIPSGAPVPRWRSALADRLEALAARLRRPRRCAVPDPFVALRVQSRLGIVAHHVQSLEADKRVMARAERIVASQLAYDDLLAEACRMAGVDIPPHATGDAAERFREEVELAGRGWAW